MNKMVFAKSNAKKEEPEDEMVIKKAPWKIIISDDEAQIHEITKLALSHFSFADRKLEFISTYTGLDTIQAITDNPDTAILLQDVVMESDDAGLEVVKYIRKELKNKFVRIILRTGQPGQAPERSVIVNYDINDYKEKTELTSQKLFTLMYSSLRSYRDIRALERNKVGLYKIIDSTADIFSRQSVDKFFSATLEQLSSLLYREKDAFMCDISKMVVKKQSTDKIEIISAIGEYANFVGQDVHKVLDTKTIDLLKESLATKKTFYKPGCCIAYFTTHSGDERLLCFKGSFRLSEMDQSLIDLYIKQISISFDNLTLYQKVEQSQQEIVNLLGTSIETRSKETGNHIKRVAEISALLATQYGLPENEIEILKLASPLHDIGKIAIPDTILNKPGKLDKLEWQTMMTHAQVGHDMLMESEGEILQAGAVISHEHHEKWNGKGYPRAIKEKEIHIFGRITAVADVFDALASERCYKKAWPMDKVIELFKEQRGLHFEPRLVDLLLDNLPEYLAILERYKDLS